MASNIKKKLDIFMAETFQESRLEEVIGDRFGRYSKYIIQERAIPDIRDGLKPVQRRILYGMSELKLYSTATYKKSARIVGEVMGKYHPHGDSSIYEALVRMSQTWKMSVPLIDIHGNNGSIDGDGPAAMRYTETRLSKNADYLLQDIDKNTVPFIPNFDEEEKEPTVLPAKFPNLLINGCMGISSGYATYIPTHNFNEVMNVTIALIDNPELTIDELLEIMPGPDLPTGGIAQGIEGIRQAFLSGSGSVVIRSKYDIEENGDAKRIVITEIPYDTVKQKTVERMEQLRIDGKVPDVIEVRDESGKDGLRIAIDLKKNANVDAIIGFYFKNTDLQVNLNYNMVSICDKKPLRLGVIPILKAYIEHQKEIITNRTNFLLNRAKKRLHIVEGLIKMVSILTEVIQTIRKSSNKADSKVNLMAKFGFSEEQAEAIVMMHLYRLSNQDIEALMAEEKDLLSKIKEYEKILKSEKELLKVIKQELTKINSEIIIPRKTVIEEQVSQIKVDETELISKEQVMLGVSKEGYIKRTSIKSYNSATSAGLKADDAMLMIKEVSTLDTLVAFTNQGNYIFYPVYKIPETKYKDIGTYVSSLVQIAPKEKIISTYVLSNFKDNKQFVLVTDKGTIKQLALPSLEASRYNKPLRAMKLGNEEELVSTDLIENPLEIMLFTTACEALRFRASDVPLYGTSAGGLKGINLKPDTKVKSVIYCNKEDDFLLLTNRGTLKRMKVTDVVLTKRARAASAVIKKVKTNPYILVSASKLTPNQFKENKEINIIYKNGNDYIEAKSLKYNVSDCGRSIINEERTLAVLENMTIANPTEPDRFVSPDYLVETTTSLFDLDDGAANEKPIKAKSTEFDILSDLEKLLASDNIKKPKIDEDNDDEKKEIKYKKISLFEDE